MKRGDRSKHTKLGCEGKVRYQTYQEAKKAMKNQKRINRSSRGGLDGAYGKVDIYHCVAEPGHWHIGKSQVKTQRLQPYNRRKYGQEIY